MPEPYKPVEVEAARSISREFSKAVVVIVSWDRVHNLCHTTTYGEQPADKISAANLGEILAKAAGFDLDQRKDFEDFRTRTKAEWAFEREQFVKACTAASHAISSLLAVREGISDELLVTVQAELEKALRGGS